MTLEEAGELLFCNVAPRANFIYHTCPALEGTGVCQADPVTPL